MPGVVRVPEGSIAEDVLKLAGGFLDGANTIYVNLAAKVFDGQRLYFPYLDEDKNPDMDEFGNGGNDCTDEPGANSFPVNSNTAGVALLCTVPGIGEVRANAIIDYRNSYGPFECIEDIKKVSGIGEASYSRLVSYICVD